MSMFLSEYDLEQSFAFVTSILLHVVDDSASDHGQRRDRQGTDRYNTRRVDVPRLCAK